MAGLRPKSGLTLLIFLFLSTGAFALEHTESFTSSAAKNTSQLIWNTYLGELHPPLWVQGWVADNDGTSATTTGDISIEVGDGRHGIFNESTLSRFGTVVGNTIVINTDQYPDLQFTYFEIPLNYTLVPEGSRPLVIRSLSDIIINGKIDCSGDDGENGTDDPIAIRKGGQGRCGGGDGGDSGVTGSPGTSGGIGVTGGGGGAIAGAGVGQGGGGGGGYGRDNVNLGGPHPPNTDGDATAVPTSGGGGVAGTINGDDGFEEDIDGAGSGGGGGSAFTNLGVPANVGSGGGGGAGGGNIRMYAVRDVVINQFGAIRANGGDGGSSNRAAGAGGGGAGGSILIFASTIFVDGPVRAMPGLGGSSVSGGDGGAGAVGRTWLLQMTGYSDAGPNQPTGEVPITELNVPGNLRYRIGVFTADSTVLDFLNTKPTLTAASMDAVEPGTGTAVFEMAVSASNNMSSFGAFADPVTLIGQTFSRFFRFQITVNNTDAATNGLTPVRVRSISLVYDGHTEKDFEFKGSCGTVGALPMGPSKGLPPPAFLLLLLLPLIIYWCRRKLPLPAEVKS